MSATLPPVENSVSPSRARVMAYTAVRDLITKSRAGALATSDLRGIPHVAIVYCIVKDDLSVYFSTRVEGRKFHNIISRPVASFAFFDEPSMRTVQLTGTAERVEALECERDILHQLMTLRHGDPNWPVPSIELFERGASNELAVIKVVPYEVTLANFAKKDTDRSGSFFTKVL